MVEKLDCDIKTTCLNKNRQDTVLLDSIDVHKGYTDPDNSTPPNTSPSDDCMSKPTPVSNDNTLLGDCGVKTIKVDTREPEDDYGWTEYTRNTENNVDGISVCEAHRVRDKYIHPYAHHTRANVDIKEENSGPKNIMVEELDCDRLNKNRQDTALFDSINVPKGYTSLRLVR